MTDELFEAVRTGDTEGAKLLIQLGADCNGAEGSSKRPVSVAISIWMGQLLHHRTPHHETPLSLQLGEIFTHSKGPYAILGCRPENVELIKLMLDNGADPNIWATNSTTPLGSAVSNHMPQTARLLLEYGANPNALTGEDHWSPFMWAIYSKQLETARLLVRKGADINYCSTDHWTALSVARDKLRDRELTSWLTSIGAH